MCWISIAGLFMQLRFLGHSEGGASLGDLGFYLLNWSVAGIEFPEQLSPLQFKCQQIGPKL